MAESAPGALLEGRPPDGPQDGAHGGCRVRSSGRRRVRDGPDRYLPTDPVRRPDRDRAQTTQDFAVGVSIFLLVLAGTVAFLPNIFAPYDQQVGSVERQQATRVADVLVSDSPYAVPDKRATLSYSDIENAISSGSLLSDLRDRAGVSDRSLAVTIYTRPGLSEPAIVTENAPFVPDGPTPPNWAVVDAAVPIDRFEMSIERDSLPSSAPFVVEIDSFSVELSKNGGQVVVTPSSGPSCSVATPNTVRTLDLDFTTGKIEVTDVDGETDTCDIETPIETNPDAGHTVSFTKGTNYPEGDYLIALAEAPSGFAERDVFDTDPSYPETSVVKVHGSPEPAKLAAESRPWQGQPSVTVSRMVTFESPADAECKPVCEVVVRVW